MVNINVVMRCNCGFLIKYQIEGSIFGVSGDFDLQEIDCPRCKKKDK